MISITATRRMGQSLMTRRITNLNIKQSRYISFQTLGVSEPIVKALTHIGVNDATNIQQASIAAASNGQSCLIQAQTGSGKTLAALIPLIERAHCIERSMQTGRNAVVTVDTIARPLSIILCPSRELVNQHKRVGKSLAHGGAKVRFESLAVDQGLAVEKRELSLTSAGTSSNKPITCLVSTPGRLLSLIRRNVISLSRCSAVVIDELDAMVEEKQGFHNEIVEIIELISRQSRSASERCQYFALAASGSTQLRDILLPHIHDLVNVTDKSMHKLPESLRIDWVDVKDSDKIELLLSEVKRIQGQPTMVFCNTASSVRAVENALSNHGMHDALAAFHGDVPARIRSVSYQEFLSGTRWLLVCSDLAARGLDVPNLVNTLQFDMARNPREFLHRVGRTNRAGTSGTLRDKQRAIVLVTKGDQALRREIEHMHGRGEKINLASSIFKRADGTESPPRRQPTSSRHAFQPRDEPRDESTHIDWADAASRQHNPPAAKDRREPNSDRREPSRDRRESFGDRRTPSNNRREPSRDRRDTSYSSIQRRDSSSPRSSSGKQRDFSFSRSRTDESDNTEPPTRKRRSVRTTALPHRWMGRVSKTHKTHIVDR